jgi:PKD repeat protein
MLHCPGYIEFPSGSSSVTIRAKAVDKGGEQLTIQLVTGCNGGSTPTVGLPQERASLKWLKYEYLPTITSITKPKASFMFTISGNTVLFDASLSTDCDGSIIMYSWAFGDTTTGNGVKTNHPYAPGTYNVKLTVFDNNGNGDVMTQTVTIGAVTNVPPKALFTFVVTRLKVDVTATGSVDTDGTIVSYSWSWGDSQSADSGFTSTHTYKATGTYNVILTVTDSAGLQATSTQQVNIQAPVINKPPTCSIGSCNV